MEEKAIWINSRTTVRQIPPSPTNKQMEARLQHRWWKLSFWMWILKEKLTPEGLEVLKKFYTSKFLELGKVEDPQTR